MHAQGTIAAIEPFPNCPALDGCHCVTSSLAKIYHHAGHPLPEEMLLGLGAGMGFIYWQMKMGGESFVFVGGRGNVQNFYQDLGARTGVRITEACTTSTKKAESELLRLLAEKTPVMLSGDMGLLPWFDLPEDYHFGGHAFVVCGYDGHDTMLASDIDQHASGLKPGLYAPITREQLSEARNSPFKPFPPKNLRLEFDFSGFRAPGTEEIAASIRQTIDAHLHPPIRNFGVSGMRHTAKQILKWPTQFNDRDLRMNLLNLYIFIEIGGTGGGCFRSMYAQFLLQAAKITRNAALVGSAATFQESALKFTTIARMFQDAARMGEIDAKIAAASAVFREIADLEEEAYELLGRQV